MAHPTGESGSDAVASNGSKLARSGPVIVPNPSLLTGSPRARRRGAGVDIRAISIFDLGRVLIKSRMVIATNARFGALGGLKSNISQGREVPVAEISSSL